LRGKISLNCITKLKGKPPKKRRKKEKTPTLGTGKDFSKFVLNTQIATHNQVNSVTPDEHSSECGGPK
jgi:hypothetical protein